MRRVRRDRARLRRRPRLPALRPQRTGRVVRDERQRRLPGPLRRALRGRGSVTLRVAGVWHDVPHRREIVEVRGADPVEVDCFETPHGPVVFGDPASGHAISMRSTALAEPSTGLAVLLPMLRARSRRRARRRDARVGRPGQQLRQRRRRRPHRLPHRRPHPGADARRTRGARCRAGPASTSGRASSPYDELPHLRDPAGGPIVTANQRIVGSELPALLGLDFARPDRARRIHDAARRRCATPRSTTWPRCTATVARWPPTSGSTASSRSTRSIQFERARARPAARLGPRDGRRTRSRPPSTWRSATPSCRIVAHSHGLAPLRVAVPRRTARGRSSRSSCACGSCSRACSRPTTRPCCLPVATWDDVLAARLSPTASGSCARVFGDDVDAWRWGALHRRAPTHPLSARIPSGRVGSTRPRSGSAASGTPCSAPRTRPAPASA